MCLDVKETRFFLIVIWTKTIKIKLKETVGGIFITF